MKLKVTSDNLLKLWAFASNEIQHPQTCYCVTMFEWNSSMHFAENGTLSDDKIRFVG